MKTYHVSLTVKLADDFSEEEVDELMTNLEVDSSVGSIEGYDVLSYTKTGA